MTHPLVLALAICAGAAALEGVLAGRGVSQRFIELRVPRLSLRPSCPCEHADCETDRQQRGDAEIDMALTVGSNRTRLAATSQ